MKSETLVAAFTLRLIEGGPGGSGGWGGLHGEQREGRGGGA